MEGADQDKLLVRKIEQGTVIDHIPAWKSELVLKVLRMDRLGGTNTDASVAILENVSSEVLGRKDVVKLDRWRIDESEADIVCLIFPTITINYINAWKVSKYSPRVPDKIEGRIKCPELSCISNAAREPLTPRFLTLKQDRMLQCGYCDTLIDFEKIPDCVMA
jgi:aspartate carbamoyltransferase regulatory subunit